jgi:hypothetical protein
VVDPRPTSPPARPASRASRTPRPVALTETDLELLRFVSEHRFVLADHAAALLGVAPVTAQRRLDKLAGGGYTRRAAVFRGRAPMHLITAAGLRALGSALPTPSLDLHNYEHDIGLAWLWLAARRGTFGPVSEVLAERTLRSRDGVADRELHAGDPRGGESAGSESARGESRGGESHAGDARGGESDANQTLGVRLGGTGPRGRERLHYPDLLLRTADGRWVALELELSTKGRTRLESILSGYGADPRIAGVVYLVQSQTVARSVERAARTIGVSDLVHLQRVRLKAARPAAERPRALERASGVTR